MDTSPSSPNILTTTGGSYPVPDLLAALPSLPAGIDLPTDGGLYRFDINQPDTNGMIDFFLRSMGGSRSTIVRSDSEAFCAKHDFGWPAKSAGVVTGPLSEGSLNLREGCERAASVAAGAFKFAVTSPYMLARTLLDCHYNDFEALKMAIAEVLAALVAGRDKFLGLSS